MRQATICAVALSVLLASGVLAADDKYAEGQKALKEFGDFMVGGVWTSHGGTLEATYTWVLNRKFIQLTSRGSGGEVKMTGFYGVDPATGKVKGWGFGSDGTTYETFLPPHEKGWFQEAQAAAPEEGSVEFRNKITIVNPDTSTHECLRFCVNGKEKEPPGPATTWNRKKAEK